MKTKLLLSISISILVTLLLIGGCATIAGVREPAGPESTLLIGRITLVCRDFPRRWYINGEHKKGVKLYLMNTSTNKMMCVSSHGKHGFFHLNDPEAGHYVILGFELKITIDRLRITMGYRAEDKSYFVISKNSVNNLGDIMWLESYIKKSSATTFTSHGNHNFKFNYDEVKNWYKEIYSNSAWNNENWVSVEIGKASD